MHVYSKIWFENDKFCKFWSKMAICIFQYSAVKCSEWCELVSLFWACTVNILIVLSSSTKHYSVPRDFFSSLSLLNSRHIVLLYCLRISFFFSLQASALSPNALLPDLSFSTENLSFDFKDTDMKRLSMEIEKEKWVEPGWLFANKAPSESLVDRFPLQQQQKSQQNIPRDFKPLCFGSACVSFRKVFHLCFHCRRPANLRVFNHTSTRVRVLTWKSGLVSRRFNLDWLTVVEMFWTLILPDRLEAPPTLPSRISKLSSYLDLTSVSCVN